MNGRRTAANRRTERFRDIHADLLPPVGSGSRRVVARRTGKVDGRNLGGPRRRDRSQGTVVEPLPSAMFRWNSRTAHGARPYSGKMRLYRICRGFRQAGVRPTTSPEAGGVPLQVSRRESRNTDESPPERKICGPCRVIGASRSHHGDLLNPRHKQRRLKGTRWLCRRVDLPRQAADIALRHLRHRPTRRSDRSAARPSTAAKVRDLEEVVKIRAYIDTNFKVEGDLRARSPGTSRRSRSGATRASATAGRSRPRPAHAHERAPARAR
jgi:hypothetical protein